VKLYGKSEGSNIHVEAEKGQGILEMRGLVAGMSLVSDNKAGAAENACKFY